MARPSSKKADLTYGDLTYRENQIDFINRVINHLLNSKTKIEVKTCQLQINTGQEEYPRRNGRFILDRQEHENLTANNGYYLFLVKNEGTVYAWKFTEACNIVYRRHLQWNKLIERA